MDSNINKHCNNSLEGYDIYVNSEKNNEEGIIIMRIVGRVVAIIVILAIITPFAYIQVNKIIYAKRVTHYLL